MWAVMKNRKSINNGLSDHLNIFGAYCNEAIHQRKVLDDNYTLDVLPGSYHPVVQITFETLSHAL